MKTRVTAENDEAYIGGGRLVYVWDMANVLESLYSLHWFFLS